VVQRRRIIWWRVIPMTAALAIGGWFGGAVEWGPWGALVMAEVAGVIGFFLSLPFGTDPIDEESGSDAEA